MAQLFPVLCITWFDLGGGGICRVKSFSAECNMNVTRPDGECSQNLVYNRAISHEEIVAPREK